MTNSELRLAIMITIQQEYEYNITQQLYTSRELWEIIKLCRDNTLNIVNLAFEKVEPKGDAQQLAELLNQLAQQQEASGLQQAIAAIKQEASLVL